MESHGIKEVLFSRPRKSLKIATVMESQKSHDDNVMEFFEGKAPDPKTRSYKQCCANPFVPVRLSFFLLVSEQITARLMLGIAQRKSWKLL